TGTANSSCRWIPRPLARCTTRRCRRRCSSRRRSARCAARASARCASRRTRATCSSPRRRRPEGRDAAASEIVAVTGPGRRAIAALVERFSTESTSYVHAAGVRLLEDPEETFPAILAAIEGARERVLLEWYWFAADNAGVRIAEALAARARQGLR